MYKVFGVLLVLLTSTAAIADDDLVLLPNTVTANACVVANTGVYANGFTMVPVYTDTIYNCDAGYYLPKNTEVCARCPENSYCTGGEYTFSESDDNGVEECPGGLYAPVGMWELAQCGRILHVGDDVVYLHRNPRTTPSMGFKFGDEVFYANMTTADVSMHDGASRHFKASDGTTVYSIYDDTVIVNEPSGGDEPNP